MSIKLKIKAENEHEFRRMLTRLAVPFLEGMVDEGETGGGETKEIGAHEYVDGFASPQGTTAPPAAPPEPDPAHTKGKTGRPRGSSKKGNGAEPSPEPQTQAQTDAAASMLTLADQVQIITEAARLDRASFAPRLDELRKSLGLDLVAKSEEKHRPILQAFIDKHGLAV
jgi:hypothetical protein